MDTVPRAPSQQGSRPFSRNHATERPQKCPSDAHCIGACVGHGVEESGHTGPGQAEVARRRVRPVLSPAKLTPTDHWVGSEEAGTGKEVPGPPWGLMTAGDRACNRMITGNQRSLGSRSEEAEGGTSRYPVGEEEEGGPVDTLWVRRRRGRGM